MKKLFTNRIMIKREREPIVEMLLNIVELDTWNPAIIEIKQVNINSFEIYRHDGINLHEIITVRETENGVTYISTGGKLAYQLVFELLSEANLTVVTEKFYVTENTNVKLSLALMAPIAKHAFNQNLAALKNLSELAR